MEKYNILIKQFREIPKLERNTNYFEITGHSHYENIASNILKFYLNPHGEHGLEELLLRSLLEICDNDYSIGGFEYVKINREEYTNTNKRIDLVIETDSYVIAIENKIYHRLNNNLKEYQNHITEKYSSDKKHLFIVLSPNLISRKEEKAIITNSKFENVTYKKLLRRVKEYYKTYAFSANVKYLIFFNEFISSIESITGVNMKEEKLKEFFISNKDNIEDLLQSYSNFKEKFFKEKIIALKGNIDDDLSSLSKEWIYQGYVLVHDFNFGNYRIAIDTIVNLDDFKITIFGRDKDSQAFLRTNKFYELTNIDKSLNPKDKVRLEFTVVEHDNSVDKISKKLNEILKKVDKGVKTYNQTNTDANKVQNG